MVIDLTFQKNSTRLTLSTSVVDATEETTRPRVRKLLKKLRQALGIAKGETLNVVIHTPADQWRIVGPCDDAPVDAGPTGKGMEIKLKGFPFGNEREVGRRIVNHREDGSAVHPNNLVTWGDLALFVRGFAGSPGSVLKETNTVKDLVNALNANEYGLVSAAIHKVGFGLSSKINAFLSYLESSAGGILPAEADPANG